MAVDERDHARRLVGSGSANYSHSCITQKLPPTIANSGGDLLPPGYVLQHAPDWVQAARHALDKAISQQRQDGNAAIRITGPSPTIYLFNRNELFS